MKLNDKEREILIISLAESNIKMRERAEDNYDLIKKLQSPEEAAPSQVSAPRELKA